jgi:RNA polymerase sigma-70 factor (ECF subfamily)
MPEGTAISSNVYYTYQRNVTLACGFEVDVGVVELTPLGAVRVLPPLFRKKAGRRARGSADRSAREDWDKLVHAIATTKDHAAFARLFGCFAARIKSDMLRSGAGEAVAEDLSQEAMFAVWRKAQLFDPAIAGAAAWIFTIARNLRIDAARRDQREHRFGVLEIEAGQNVDLAPLPDDRLVAAQTTELVRRALAKLSIDDRHIIQLSFFEDKAHQEISRTLKIPLGTVKSRVRRALFRLRDLLDP